jgi:hypothetical protein
MITTFIKELLPTDDDHFWLLMKKQSPKKNNGKFLNPKP